MKKLMFSILLLCLCSSTLFAQRSASYGTISPEGSNRDITPGLWDQTTLYYYISNYSNNLNYAQCQSAIQNAFTTWANHSRFTFIQTYSLSQADIILRWYTENEIHGDYCNPFNNTVFVAHSTPGKFTALSPPGQVHFNDLCTFSTDGTQFDVESVALHEIGHVLGIPDNYTNSSYVMYYQITSGTVKRNLTSYDITTLYNTYNHPSAINGRHLIVTNSLYTLSNLPPKATVQWSVNDINYSSGIAANQPEYGQCLVTRNTNYDMMGATLTATIKYGGETVDALTFQNIYAYSGFWGQYTSGNLSGNINYTYYFNIRTNTATSVFSPNFYGATVTYSSSGATPTAWGHNPDTGILNFKTASPGAAVVINVTDCCGYSYVLYAYATSQYGINVSSGGDYITVTLNDDDDSQRNSSIDQSWTIEVLNVTTGQLMATRSSASRSELISTVGWPKGIYIVKVTIGEDVLTEKVIVK